MRHALFMQQFFNQPLMVLPDLASLGVAWAGERMGVQLTQVNIGASAPEISSAAPTNKQEVQIDSGVAVIGIHGVLVPRALNVDLCTQQTSYESIRRQVNMALADPSVERIILDIDSPGGAAVGNFELARDIRAARDIKPITALAHYGAYSAAYMIASACSEIIMSETAGVGSIGVIMKHADFSQQLAERGITVTTLYRGAHKNDLAPESPLTEEARAFAEARIDAMYDLFVNSVADFRGLDVDLVRGTEAGVFFGQNAVDAGLADRIEHPQAAVNRIVSELAASRPSQNPVRRISAQAAAMSMAAKL